MGLWGAIRRWFSLAPAASPAIDAAPIRARYDAAQSAGVNQQHWLAADALSADAAHSPTVRRALVRRSRYEIGNNGHGKGIVETQANYVVGRGPKLRLLTASRGFNKMVEARWNAWAKRVKLARKLRTAVKAKVGDGEGILIARANPALRNPVQIDLVGIETDQLSTPLLGAAQPGRVDGIDFDPFGNAVTYYVLAAHPGGPYANPAVFSVAEAVPARFVFHIFREDRPGQHRAVPELTSSLNCFAQGRRYREATVAAAENIANWSILIQTQNTPDTGADLARPFTSLPNEKGMLVAMPAGYHAFQPKAEQPSATYDEFTKNQGRDEARPINMPGSIAMCDSSGLSFSGGKLDHLTYFVSVDVEQADLEDLCLDPLFDLWYAEASRVYGWTGDPDSPPAHTWDWPARPQIDELKTATARQVGLSCGAMSLRRIYADDGYDLEDELTAMAEDYGVTVDEMRLILLRVNLLSKLGQSPSPPNPAVAHDTAEEVSFHSRARNGRAALSPNGNGRSR